MAKSEYTLHGEFDEVLSSLEQGILRSSSSASLEEQTYWKEETARCAVLVFERYSMTGGNRLSLTLTLFSTGDTIRLSAITAGGSQAVFFKMNTWGEESFLRVVDDLIDQLRKTGKIV